MIIFVYAVLVFLTLRFSVTLFNFLSNPKLGHYGKRFTEQVSVIVVLTDENENVSELTASIKNQDYKYTEVIIKQHYEDERIAVNKATGNYLLFLDANTIIHKGLINNLICRTKVYDLALLSLIPNRKLKHFFEWVLYPVNDFVLLNLLPLRLVRLIGRQTFTIANTACMFFVANTYKQNSRHDRFEGKTEVLLANRFVYDQGNVSFDDLGKQLLLNFGNNILATIIYLMLVVAGPVIIFCNFSPYFMALPVGLMFLTKIMVSFLTNQKPVINILLHPVQMLMLFLLSLKGLWNRILTLINDKK